MKSVPAASRSIAIVLMVLMACPPWLLAAVTNEPALPDPGLAAPRDQQIQLGQKAVAEIYKQMPILPDSDPLSRYVQSLGARLQQVIPQQYNWPYSFHVVQQKEINAFALPGGPIFVNVGTINAAANEAELAGVISHEMAHVYMQHSVKQMQKSAGANAISGIGQILGAIVGGPLGALASIGGQLGGGLLTMRFSRADEAQADAVGAIIMYKADYNPVRLAQFFQKLESQDQGAGPQFLSDHPNPGNRVAAVQKEVQNWPSKRFQDNSAEFQTAHAESLRVRAYTAQQIAQMAKTGQIRNTSGPGRAPANEPMGRTSTNEVMPSGGFQPFDGAFSLEYPSNWKPSQDQQNGSVLFAPPAGISQSGIAYGALISQFQPQNANSLDDATQQLISSLQQQNQGMRVAGKPQTVRVNGITGRSVDLLSQSPISDPNGQPMQERDWLVAIPDSNGNLVSLVFIAPERDFVQLRPTYEQMLRSFHLNQ